MRAAVLVGALVGRGGEEAAHDGRVAALQFDAVEATLGAVFGDQAYPAMISSISACGDGLGDFAEQRVGDRRRRPDRQARVHRTRLPAVVVDLGEDRDSMAVHGVGDRAIARDDVAVEAVDELLVRPVGGVGRCAPR